MVSTLEEGLPKLYVKWTELAAIATGFEQRTRGLSEEERGQLLQVAVRHKARELVVRFRWRKNCKGKLRLKETPGGFQVLGGQVELLLTPYRRTLWRELQPKITFDRVQSQDNSTIELCVTDENGMVIKEGKPFLLRSDNPFDRAVAFLSTRRGKVGPADQKEFVRLLRKPIGVAA